MTSTYTPSLRFDLQGSGDNTLSWGTVANGDFTMIDAAIAGMSSITMTDANYTLSVVNGAFDEARPAILNVSGTNTATRTIIIPGVSKTYIVNNNTVGGFPIIVKTNSAPGITVYNGTRAWIYTDGVSMFSADDGGMMKQWNAAPMQNFRNAYINGNMDFAQRATTGSAAGYVSLDRWYNTKVGSGSTMSQQAFSLGQTAVPGNPEFYMRVVVTSVAGANNYVYISQTIEDVRTYSGQLVTATFWARSDATRNIAYQSYQYFGSGGSASSGVGQPLGQLTLTTSWQRFDIVYTVPSIAGKTIGTDNMDGLSPSFWLDAGSNQNTQASNLGQQSGTFEFSRISLNLGDCSKEVDPFAPRPQQVERALCMRYYQQINVTFYGYQPGAGTFAGYGMHYPVPMRATPSLTQVAAGTFLNGTARNDQATSTSIRVGADSAATGTVTVNNRILGLDAEL